MLSVVAMLLATAFHLRAQDAAEPVPPAAPADAAVAPAADAPDPATLLARSREKLAGFRTLQAKMTETVDFGPARRFKADGRYLQGTGNKVRVDLNVDIGKNKGKLLQVCEGDVLWTVYEVGSAPKITRRDVNQILAAAKGAEAKSTWLAELGLGGLPALLAAIEGSIDFKPTLTTTIEDRPFYVLEGTWKPAVRAQFEAQMQQPPAADGQKVLPGHVPELVRVYIEAESLFPYRIRYLKQSPAPGQAPRPLLTIDFREIVVNAPIAKEDFQYVAPEGPQVVDITKQFVDQLQAQAQAQAQAQSQGGQGQPAPAPQ